MLKQNGFLLTCNFINYIFIKNIPKKRIYIGTAEHLALNPNKKRYMKYIEREINDSRIIENLLNSLPEDFDINKHVRYNENKNIVEYSEFIIKFLTKVYKS